MTAKKKKKLLVTGNMRCGTTWMTHALRAVGLDCQHECMGEDGTVSWFFAIDAPSYPFNPRNTPKGRTAHVGEGRRSDYRFEHVVHLVRDPLKTLGSMMKIMPRKEQEWLDDNGMLDMGAEPKLLRMMQAWYLINTEVEAIATYRIRLEDVTNRSKNDWDKFMREIDWPSKGVPSVPVKNASRGIFKATRLIWHDLHELDPVLADKIAEMARRYGYAY